MTDKQPIRRLKNERSQKSGGAAGGRRRLGGSHFTQHCENCLFTKIDVSEPTAEEGFVDCSVVPPNRVRCPLVDGRLTLGRRSVARDAARQDAWILAAVGDEDVYGNARVRDGGVDVGAVECQEEARGLAVTVR